jgi:hypothetical protein
MDIFGGFHGMGAEDPAAGPDAVVPGTPPSTTTLPETSIWGSPPSSTWDSVVTFVGYVGMAAGAYHGYKRSPKHKVWGAIGYSLLGGLWIIGIPIMLAQGFGKPKGRK